MRIRKLLGAVGLLLAVALAGAVWSLARQRPELPLRMPVRWVSPTEVRSSFGAPRSGGRRHQGVDIFAPRGTEVVAATSGIVVFKGTNRLGGRVLYVLGEGVLTYYAHLDDWDSWICLGQCVRRGMPLGKVGDSGNARGGPCHLHFALHPLWNRGRAVDPVPHFKPNRYPTPRSVALRQEHGATGADAMRWLLVSDTHGHLEVVNRLAEETRADAVVHAGDLGFYEPQTIERLTVKELVLRILHSDLPREEVKATRKLMSEQLRSFLAERVLLGDFPDHLAGRRRFTTPVYAVWGNHEDKEVLEALREGRVQVENLHLLDERQTFRVGPFHLVGLGGNVLVGEKLFHRPVAGGGGRVWSTLSQFGRLIETAGPKQAGEVRVLVTHVSPGKEPLIGLLAVKLGADYLISGHMGQPYGMVWNEFSIRTLEEAVTRLQSAAPAVEAAWADESEFDRSEDERRWIELGLELVRGVTQRLRPPADERREPAWYRKALAINLPDIADGYAVLEDVDGRVALEARSRGKEFGAGQASERRPDSPLEN